ncbi:MAG: surface-adhesin E family protein [Gallionella sp.]|jgi:hypothetical protein
MHKYLLTLILTLPAADATAEWQSIGENADETAYVDADHIQHGKHRKMWALFDLKTPRTLGDKRYLSMKIQREYSCHGKRSRITTRRAYSGNMAAGDLIYSNDKHDNWVVIQPDSAEEALLNMACEKKRE